ncbi:MAG: bacteriohemerythrin [Bacillota bacterium]|nr:bacteriohemerythrin [Bacillota bacterium]
MFDWKDTYSTSISKIDEQHKQLFELAHNLYSIVSKKGDKDNYDELAHALSELKDYTVYHFEYEEKLMEQYNFPEVMAHTKEHSAFVDKISEVKAQDLDLNQNKVAMDLLMFIANWIESHILKSDIKYKDFFK